MKPKHQHSTDRASKDIARFDEWSATYDRSRMQRWFFEPVQRAALEAAAAIEPSVVLDIGCGTGRLLSAASRRWPGARLIGIDAALGMLREAAVRLPDAVLLQAQAESIPIESSTIDLAISTISAHHWADKAAGVREIARVLRPGGTFVLADVSAGRWLSTISRESPYWRAGDRERELRAAGFRIAEQRKLRWRAVLITTAIR